MSFEFSPYTSHFSNQLKSILEKYPKSQTAIEEVIMAKTQDFTLQNKIRFLGYGVRRIRIPLTEYRIGVSRGLRLVYIIAKDKIHLITIYSKSDLNRSREINCLIIAGWKEIDFEL